MIANISRHQWLDFEAHRPLVVACAKRFLRSQSACSLSLDDLMQEAWLAMYEASPHLWRVPAEKRTAYLSNAITYTLLRVYKRHRPLETGVTDCVAEECESPAELPLDRLKASERRLLKAHLGLNGRTPQTLKSLAAKWGVSTRTLERRLASCRESIRKLDR